MTKLKVALIPGDGIGVEVVREAVKVLDALAPRSGLTPVYTSYDIGSRRYLATGELMPKSVLGELAQSDAILFGAIGDPSVAPGILERGIILELRFAFQYYLNLRPVRLLRGAKGVLADKGPDDIDMVVLREGTEGPYAGAGGSVHTGSPLEVVTETAIHTRTAVERIVRDAFERSLKRRKKVCLIAKTNILVHSGSLWQRTFDEVAVQYPDVETDYVHVDAAAMYLLTSPERFDVVVTDNMFGDILTDIGAAIAGGIGLAASGNINPTRRNPSMFEPVHGSAPDIAGQSKADPTAAVLSLAMLLEHVGQAEAARLVQAAVEADLMERGGTVRSTEQIGDALAELAATLA